MLPTAHCPLPLTTGLYKIYAFWTGLSHWWCWVHIAGRLCTCYRLVLMYPPASRVPSMLLLGMHTEAQRLHHHHCTLPSPGRYAIVVWPGVVEAHLSYRQRQLANGQFYAHCASITSAASFTAKCAVSAARVSADRSSQVISGGPPSLELLLDDRERAILSHSPVWMWASGAQRSRGGS